MLNSQAIALFFQLLFLAFVLATIVQLSFWVGVFSKLAFYKPADTKEPLSDVPPVSIVICAKNERKNLEANIYRILNQQYRCFEILVIDDNSMDDSFAFLLDIQAKHSTFRVLRQSDTYNNKNYTKNSQGKKRALAFGIEAARYDWLLLTDADCAPATEYWLQDMMQGATQEKQLVLGYAPLEEYTGLLNKFIRYETTYAAIQYLSFALLGMPYMGVGRNLLYHRSLYRQANGFDQHTHVASGDDDLFVNQVATATNTAIVLRPTTQVLSAPKTDWSSFLKQKSRHLTTGKHYRWQHQLLLGMLAVSHVGHYTGGILLLLFNYNGLFVVLLYALRCLVVLAYTKLIFNKLQEKTPLYWIFLLDPLLVLYYVFFAPTLWIGKNVKWK
jgi:glycosyltransferase involved in cell wall biosynthesis